MNVTTDCLACDRTDAKYGRRWVAESTSGPVEMVALHCEDGHHFNLPVSMLAERKERDGSG